MDERVGRDWHDNKPKLSTWLGALWLSTTWTGMYFIVFFSITWILNLDTPALTLLIGLWMSVLAEAYIRWFENSDKIARYTKPLSNKRKGDNQGYPKWRAWLLILIGVVLFAVLGFVADSVGYGLTEDTTKAIAGSFEGQHGDKTFSGLMTMLVTWKNAILNPVFLLGIVPCILMRVVIYKRDPYEAYISDNETQS